MRWWPFARSNMPETVVLAGDSYNLVCEAIGAHILSPGHVSCDKRIIVVRDKRDIHRVRDLPSQTRWVRFGSVESKLFFYLYKKFGPPKANFLKMVNAPTEGA